MPEARSSEGQKPALSLADWEPSVSDRHSCDAALEMHSDIWTLDRVWAWSAPAVGAW